MGKARIRDITDAIGLGGFDSTRRARARKYVIRDSPPNSIPRAIAVGGLGPFKYGGLSISIPPAPMPKLDSRRRRLRAISDRVKMGYMSRTHFNVSGANNRNTRSAEKRIKGMEKGWAIMENGQTEDSKDVAHPSIMGIRRDLWCKCRRIPGNLA